MSSTQAHLHGAIAQGDLPSVLALLGGGASLEERCNRGTTPLMEAAMRGNVEIIASLITLGALQTSVDSDGLTPLHYAAMRGGPEAVTVLLNGQVDVNAVDSTGHRTPLYLAAVHARPACTAATCHVLLHAGADPHAKTKWGSTALFDCMRLSRDYAWDVLVAAGANIDERDTGGGTALMAMAKHGTPSHKLERILQLGADINARDFHGRSAIMLAAMYGQIGVLQRLLTNGADVNAVDYTGRNALYYCEATALKDSDITTMLLPGDTRSERLHTRSNSGSREAPVRRSLVHAREEAAQLLRAAMR